MTAPLNIAQLTDEDLEPITDETEVIVQIDDKYYRCHVAVANQLEALKQRNADLIRMAQGHAQSSSNLIVPNG